MTALHISQIQSDILFKFSGFYILIDLNFKWKNTESQNPKGSKICIFRNQPIAVIILTFEKCDFTTTE